MPRVYLTSAGRFEMPRLCVCCGRAATGSFEEFGDHDVAKPRERASLRFPVCDPCLTHHAYNFGQQHGPPPPRSPECESVRCLADFVSWRGAEHVIDFDSPRFARALVDANAAAKKKVWCDYTWVPASLSPAPKPAPATVAPATTSKSSLSAVVLLAILLASAWCCLSGALNKQPAQAPPGVTYAPLQPQQPTPTEQAPAPTPRHHRHRSGDRSR